MDLRLAALKISTDRSIAESIREALLPLILEQFPSGYFEDKLYDTHESGKGFRPGYVSFGLRPVSWTDKGLIGGCLVRGSYSSDIIKSNSPEQGTPEWKEWKESGGNSSLSGGEAGEIDLSVGYYNKSGQSSFSMGRSLGVATFTIDDFEEVEDMELSDPDGLQDGIESLVDEVLKSPPEGATSQSKSVLRKQSPYSSLRKFLFYLSDEGRSTFRPDEIKAISQFTGKNEREITEWLNKRGLSPEVMKAAARYPSW